MPGSLPDGAQRLVRVETKLDDLIREVREYFDKQTEACLKHNDKNEDEHYRIWVAIDDFRMWKFKVIGIVMAFLFMWTVVSTVVATFIVNVISGL